MPMDQDDHFFPGFHFLVYEIRRLDQMSSQFYDFMIILESKTYRAKFPLPRRTMVQWSQQCQGCKAPTGVLDRKELVCPVNDVR